MLQKSPEERERERLVREMRKEQVTAAFFNGLGTAGGLLAFSLIAGIVAKMFQVF